MSWKLFYGLFAVFAILTVISAVFEGGGGIVVTRLTSAIGDDDITIPVESTAGFLQKDYIYIGDELIYYDGKTNTSFTGCVRGCKNTQATAHPADAQVRTEAANVLNSLAQYNIMAAISEAGIIKAPWVVGAAIKNSLQKIFLWDYSFLEGDLVVAKYLIFYPLSAAVVIMTLYMLSGLIRGIFTGG